MKGRRQSILGDFPSCCELWLNALPVRRELNQPVVDSELYEDRVVVLRVHRIKRKDVGRPCKRERTPSDRRAGRGLAAGALRSSLIGTGAGREQKCSSCHEGHIPRSLDSAPEAHFWYQDPPPASSNGTLLQGRRGPRVDRALAGLNMASRNQVLSRLRPLSERDVREPVSSGTPGEKSSTAFALCCIPRGRANIVRLVVRMVASADRGRG